jgi:hypothetical protein
MSTADLTGKFRRNAEPLLDGASIDACVQRILTLEDQPDLEGVIDPAAPPVPAPAANPAPAPAAPRAVTT